MRVSIFINSYNKKQYLINTINSVLSQTINEPYKLFIKDYSTNGTREMLKTIISDKIDIEYLSINDPITQQNKFMEETPYLYNFFSHDDVIFHPDFLEKMVKVLDTGKEAVYCNYNYIRINGTKETYKFNGIYYKKDKPDQLRSNLGLVTMGFNKSIFQKMSKPYQKNYFPYYSLHDHIESSYGLMDNIEKVADVYPVIDENKETEILVDHIATVYSDWNIKGGDYTCSENTQFLAQ